MVERHGPDLAPIRLWRYRIDDADKIRTGDAAALFALLPPSLIGSS
jgi:hypothetical protein